MNQVDLRSYDNSWFRPGRSVVWQAAWMFLGLPVLRSAWITSPVLRTGLLRAFGARVGERVVMRHGMKVKYPWHLVVGDDCWFGEECWIDNLTTVTIGSNVCVSQGAYLCTGNHDWTDPAFGLIVAPIRIEDGAWVGAKCIVGPGVVFGAGAVAGAGSVVSRGVGPYEVHAGNPAVLVKRRVIREGAVEGLVAVEASAGPMEHAVAVEGQPAR